MKVWAVSLSLVLVTSVFSFATPVQQVYAQGEIIAPDIGLIPITSVFSFTTIITPNTGGDCDGDCRAPTLGLDVTGKRFVENGFTYNGNTINVERYLTPYPLITVDVGMQNTAVFKIYENYGPSNLRDFDLAFGLTSGQIMGTSNAMIQWDKSFDGVETVSLVDPYNVLDNVRVETSEGKCRTDSSTNDCLIVTVYHKFRAPLEYDIVATNVWDQERNSWQNYYNHGIHIEGESLNPAKTVMVHIGNTRADAGLKQLTQIDRFADTWTDEVGNIYHYNGNHWFTLIQAVEKEFIPDGTTSHGFDRYSNLFSLAVEKQRSIAGDVMCVIDHRVCDNIEFEEIDNIFVYEYPTVQKDRLAGTLLNSHS